MGDMTGKIQDHAMDMWLAQASIPLYFPVHCGGGGGESRDVTTTNVTRYLYNTGVDCWGKVMVDISLSLENISNGGPLKINTLHILSIPDVFNGKTSLTEAGGGNDYS